MNYRQYKDYLESHEWAEKREDALERHGRRCKACGSRSRLNVHHKNYKRLGRESVYDLEVLCGDCHAKIHGKV